MSNDFQEYQIIELTKDINPILKKGMQGVILIKYNDNAAEAEFVKEDGRNYEYNGQFTFTLNSSDFKIISSDK
ncbi:MAG: hypothetical protein ACTHMD_14380 [Flavisolibacter sp.]